MSEISRITGGCLCGAVRYEARGEPDFAGFCCCKDCQRMSGSGFIPFMGFSAEAITITGETRPWIATSIRGTDAVRSRCVKCGSLVHGGVVGKDPMHTVYAGTLDDSSHFRPKMVIFNRDRPAWVALPEGVAVYETMPQA